MIIHAKIAVLAIAGALLTGCHGQHRAYYGGGYGYYEQPRVYVAPPVYERPRYAPPRRDWYDDRPRRDHHHHDGWNGDWHRRDRD